LCRGRGTCGAYPSIGGESKFWLNEYDMKILEDVKGDKRETSHGHGSDRTTMLKVSKSQTRRKEYRGREGVLNANCWESRGWRIDPFCGGG